MSKVTGKDLQRLIEGALSERTYSSDDLGSPE